MMRRSSAVLLASFGLLLAAAGCGDGHDHAAPAAKPASSAAAPADPNVKPYPLKTCVVSGEELGKMGEPFRFVHQGQEIKLCCKGCEKDFLKEPAKYLGKLAAAEKK